MFKEPRWAVAALFAATCPPLSLFHDEFIDQKWSVTAIVVLVLLTRFFLRPRTPSTCRFNLPFASVAISLYLCLFAFLRSWARSLPLAGPFENPNVLALHLCLLLPFVHEGCVRRNKSRSATILFVLAEVISVGTIVFCQCRTAWICLVLFYSLALLRGKWRLVVVPALMCVGLASMFVFKQSSSQGRMFILQNTVEMIAEAPLLGHGTNAFEREYMPRQAEYFRTHDNAEAEMLADDIRHPLNEFLLVGVNHGVLGMSVLAVLLCFPLVWRRRLYDANHALWSSLLMLFVFCQFLYPLLYPLSWLLLVGGWWVLLAKPLTRWLPRLRIMLLSMTVAALMLVTGYTCLLMAWGYASKIAKHGHSAEVMPIYESLFPYLSWHSIFLYDYAIESFYAGEINKTDSILSNLEQRVVSYDGTLLHGDVCYYSKRYDEAISYYSSASAMCPCRFAPLEGMMKVYDCKNDSLAKDSLLNVVVHKPVKCSTKKTIEIINNIKSLN